MDDSKNSKNFFMTIENSIYQKIKRLASKRGLTVQEFTRAVIIPEWFENKKIKK